ncbi:MAG: PAS domain S-box protein [Hydrogenovibrio sp.]|nr:PAS domain S-box protein [Hydrogenovibrio sp.]
MASSIPSNLYQALFDRATDALAIIAPETGQVVHCNEATTALFGISVTGKDLADLSPEMQTDSQNSADQLSKYFDRACETGAVTFEWQYLKSDDTLFSTENTFSYAKIDGQSWILAAIRDISDQKSLEVHLNEAQSLARIGSWEYDIQQDYLWWSDEIYRIFEIDPKDFKASYQAFMEMVHPDDREMVNQIYQKSLAERSPYELDHRLLLSDGRIKYVHERGQQQLDKNGIPVRTLGTVQDITGRKQSEERIQLFRTLIDHSVDAIEVLDPETFQILDVNDTECRALGYTREELLSMRIIDIDPKFGADEDFHKQILAQIQQTGSAHFETIHRRKDGSTFPVEVTPTLVELDRPYLISVARDITERKKVETQLKKSEQAYRSLAQNLPGLVYRVFIQEDLRMEFYNDMPLQLTGYSTKELSGGEVCSIDPLILKQDKPQVVSKVSDAIKENRAFSVEYRLKHKNGDIRWMREYGRPIQDDEGLPLYIDGLIFDITEQKHTQELLWQNEEKFRALVESTTDWIWEVDENGIYTYVSPQVESLIGYTPDEVLGKTPFDFMPDAEAERIGKHFVALVEHHAPIHLLENVVQCKNGDFKVMETSGIPFFDEKGNYAGYRGTDRDVTVRKETELALAESEATAHTLINANPETAILIDRNGTILAMNDTAAERLHKQKNAIIGTDIYTLLPENLVESRRNQINQAFQNGHPIHFKDVREGIHFETDLYPINNPEGQPTSLAIYATDITEQFHRQGTERLLNTIDQQVLAGEPIDKIFSYICKEITQVFDYQHAWIGSKEKDGHIVVQAGSCPLCECQNQAEKGLCWNAPDFNANPTSLAINTGKMQILEMDTPSLETHQCVSAPAIKTVMSFPLIINHEIYGALTLCSEHKYHIESPNTIDRLSGIATRISISLEKAKNQQQMSLLSTALAATANGILITDTNGVIQWSNEALTRLTGYQPSDLIGKTPKVLNSGKQDDLFYENLWKTILKGEVWREEMVDRRKDGSELYTRQTITPMRDEKGELSHFIAVLEDISSEVAAKEQIEHMAHYDTLTNLPNRALFQDRLERVIARSKRYDQRFALLFLDLDHFKNINDTLGHDMGDALLKEAAARILNCVREMDTVARMGGDEFTVILPELKSVDDAHHIAQSIIQALLKPFELKGEPATIGCSIGIAVYPDVGKDEETLLKHADTAMYEAKKHRNTVRVFEAA